MLFLLSPAKSLDYVTPVDSDLLAQATKPPFLARSAELIGVLKEKTPAQVAELMDLSQPLAQLNVARYAGWSRRTTEKNSKPAVFAFNGDVYDGLQARSLAAEDIAWAQEHLIILSGLYGALRPLDLVQPYRLEMGTRLAVADARDLYGYWGDTLAEHLNKRLRANESPVVVNLASQEYFRAANRKILQARVVECVFEDWKNGQYKVISFFAKRARGAMARYAIQRRLATPRELEGFAEDGYAFAPGASAPDRLVFRRRAD